MCATPSSQKKQGPPTIPPPASVYSTRPKRPSCLYHTHTFNRESERESSDKAMLLTRAAVWYPEVIQEKKNKTNSVCVLLLCIVRMDSFWFSLPGKVVSGARKPDDTSTLYVCCTFYFFHFYAVHAVYAVHTHQQLTHFRPLRSLSLSL